MIRPQFKRNGGIDKQLEDLVQASSWKQAIALCEKRIRKGDKSDAALVAKAHVLLACPDVVRRQQGSKELESLTRKESPVVDIEVLTSIHIFTVYRNGFQDSLKSLWARAAKARPQDDKLLEAWFGIMFHSRRYQEAQEASIAYRTQFPHEHHAHFWYIITCYLLANSKDSDETLRTINQGLVFGNLAKAAKAVGPAGQSSTKGLVIEGLEDLLLLLRVYQSQRKFKDAVKVLDDDRTGISSPIGNNNWQLVRQKIGLLEQSGQWHEMWQFCSFLLDDALPENLAKESRHPYFAFGRLGDDWTVWAGLIAATNRICIPKMLSQAETYTYSFPKSSRNARIARLKLYALHSTEDVDSQSKLLRACEEHFTDFSTKTVCFHDLSPYVPSLKREHRAELLKVVAKHARSLTPGQNKSEGQAVLWMISEINVLKLQYYLCISIRPMSLDKALLEVFVSRCLALYNISMTLFADVAVSERRPGDDAAILATMALVHVADLGESTALLRCAVILETLLGKSRHNYDALLIQLSLKNMQQATMSWILHTHISLLHPYPYVGKSINGKARPVMDFTENVANALDWHATAAQANSDFLDVMLQRAQYDMLVDTLSLDETIKSGFTNLLLMVEGSRIQRLTGASSQKNYLDLLKNSSGPIQDSRDTGVFPTYEGEAGAPFIDRVEHGVRVDRTWLSSQLQMATLWDKLEQSVRTSDGVVPKMCCSENPLADDVEVQLEKTERKTLILGGSLLVSFSSGHKPDVASGPITQTLEGLERLLMSIIEVLEFIEQSLDGYCTRLSPTLSIPHAAYFKFYFGMFGICHTINKIVDCGVIWNQQEKLVESVHFHGISARIRAANKAIAVKAESQASAMQSALQRDHALDCIVAVILNGQESQQDLISLVLRRLVDRRSMEMIAVAMRESWIEALEGIVKAARYLGSI